MFKLTIKTTNKVMDKKLVKGDMFIQDKDSADRKVYLAVEVLGELKLVNINSAQTFNKKGYTTETRQQVLDIVTDHFHKHDWVFIPAEDVKSKDLVITAIEA